MSSDSKGLILRDCNVLDTDFNGRFIIQKDAEIAIKKGVIEAVGPRGSLVGASMDYEVLSCDSAWVTPGLIDCHTHLVYGGNRIDEYQARLGGGSYLSMNEAGGGIYHAKSIPIFDTDPTYSRRKSLEGNAPPRCDDGRLFDDRSRMR